MDDPLVYRTAKHNERPTAAERESTYAKLLCDYVNNAMAETVTISPRPSHASTNNRDLYSWSRSYTMSQIKPPQITTVLDVASYVTR